jgi:putative PIN family toxin of toxin-antitoxin system
MTRRTARVPRVVLDTNVVVSSLVFAGGIAAALRTAWQSGRMVPLISRDTASELVRVLRYPKFSLDAAAQELLLGDYLPYAAAVNIPLQPPALPACRDPSDLPFLVLATVGQADMLVTGDRDLLDIAAEVSFRVMTPAAALDHLGLPTKG